LAELGGGYEDFPGIESEPNYTTPLFSPLKVQTEPKGDSIRFATGFKTESIVLESFVPADLRCTMASRL